MVRPVFLYQDNVEFAKAALLCHRLFEIFVVCYITYWSEAAFESLEQNGQEKKI